MTHAAYLDHLSRLAIGSFSSTREIIEAILVLIVEQLGLRTSFLTQITFATNQNKVLYAHNTSGGCDLSAGIELPYSDTFCSTIFSWDTPMPVLIDNTRLDPVYSQHPAASAFPGVGCFIGVPVILSDGSMHGTLCASDPDPHLLETHHASLLLVLARTIATQLERDYELERRIEAEAALHASETRFQRIMANIPGMVFQFVLQPDGTAAIPYISQGCRAIYDQDPEAIKADPGLVMKIVHPDDRVGHEQSIRTSAETMMPWQWEGRVILASGEQKWLQGASRPELQADGCILWDGLLMDITERKRTEERLWEAEARFQSVVQSASDAIILADDTGRIISVNRSTEPMFGYTGLEVGGQPLGLLMPDLARATPGEEAGPTQLSQSAPIFGKTIELHGLHKDGTTFPVEVALANWETQSARYYSGIIRDITERKRAEEQLLHQAEQLRALSLVDDLTTLYNHRGFLTLAQQHMKISQRGNTRLSILFADMDGLKQINDVYGHYEGDRALVDLATIFKATFREADIVARLGGDEFVVLAGDISAEHVEALIERFCANIETLNGAQSRPYPLSVSIGVAHYDPDQPCSIEELLARADMLMYEQKRSKKLTRG